MKKIKVLICDDSALMRRILERIINNDPELEVIGRARNGEDAIQKARELMPDVITMDINMPVMDGITSLQIIASENIAPVIMVSSLTQEGAVITFEALELGAFDFVEKPGGTVSRNLSSVEDELREKIKAAYLSEFKDNKSKTTRKKIKNYDRQVKNKVSLKSKHGFKAIAIGISTGGPKTIFDVLPYLPANLNAAVFLVQHMPPTFTSTFAERLNKHCKMNVYEASAGMIVEPGNIYVGKGGYHMKLVQGCSSGELVIRTTTKPEHLFIPSVDVMMDSVLDHFGEDTVGVLMTGMGNDGASGMLKIRKAGGATIAESQESAIVFGMPRQAIEIGAAKLVAPRWEIAAEIIKAVDG